MASGQGVVFSQIKAEVYLLVQHFIGYGNKEVFCFLALNFPEVGLQLQRIFQFRLEILQDLDTLFDIADCDQVRPVIRLEDQNPIRQKLTQQPAQSLRQRLQVVPLFEQALLLCYLDIRCQLDCLYYEVFQIFVVVVDQLQQVPLAFPVNLPARDREYVAGLILLLNVLDNPPAQHQQPQNDLLDQDGLLRVHPAARPDFVNEQSPSQPVEIVDHDPVPDDKLVDFVQDFILQDIFPAVCLLGLVMGAVELDSNSHRLADNSVPPVFINLTLLFVLELAPNLLEVFLVLDVLVDGIEVNSICFFLGNHLQNQVKQMPELEGKLAEKAGSQGQLIVPELLYELRIAEAEFVDVGVMADNQVEKHHPESIHVNLRARIQLLLGEFLQGHIGDGALANLLELETLVVYGKPKVGQFEQVARYQHVVGLDVLVQNFGIVEHFVPSHQLIENVEDLLLAENVSFLFSEGLQSAVGAALHEYVVIVL